MLLVIVSDAQQSKIIRRLPDKFGGYGGYGGYSRYRRYGRYGGLPAHAVDRVMDRVTGLVFVPTAANRELTDSSAELGLEDVGRFISQVSSAYLPGSYPPSALA